ncbi:MAG: putative Ig domain-containing protein [Bryobacteraceae bacterium]
MRSPIARRAVLLPILCAVLCGGLEAQAIRSNSGFRRISIPANDDGSSAIAPLGFTINFFGRLRPACYVNNNGNVTFDSPLATFTPFGLDGTRREIIAPFFADVDTRAAGSQLVTYGEDTVDGRKAFGVNWIDVGYYDTKADRLNSFQLVIIDRSDTGSGNFDIEFNYAKIQWETGDASGGVNGLGGVPAAVGWSNGSGEPGTSFEVAGSLVPGAFLDRGSSPLIRRRMNSPVMGRLMFRARDGALIAPLSIHSAFPNGVLGREYSHPAHATGGRQPYEWSLIPDPGVTLPGIHLTPDGILQGTPTATGVFDFTLRVTSRIEGSVETATRRASLAIVPAAPEMVSVNCPLPPAMAGVAYAQTLRASGSIPYRWTWGENGASPIPGLRLTENGQITGVPEYEGTYIFPLQLVADDPAIPATTRSCSLTVKPAPLAVEVAFCPVPKATVGVPYSSALTVGGGSGPFRWSLIGQLPNGLMLSAAGQVSGIPSFAGEYRFALRVQDAKNEEAIRMCQLTVTNPELTIGTACPLPGGNTGSDYLHELVVGGGEAPYSWSVQGSLPPGVSLRDGVLSGRPGAEGAYQFRLSAWDRLGRAASQPCSLIVQRAELNLASCALPNGRLDETYSRQLTLDGGRAPYRWTASGALPPGVRLTSEGLLTGNPSTPGEYLFNVQVIDADQRAASQSCRVQIEPQPVAIPTECPLPGATVGKSYSTTLKATGGIAPYRWSVEGAPPAGLDVTPGGSLTGTAVAAGAASFDLVVTDSRGHALRKSCAVEAVLPEAPEARLTGLPAVIPPATGLPAVTIALARPYELALEGELVIEPEADTGSQAAPVNRPDGAVRFLNGLRSWPFRIPAGTTELRVPLATSGTVASRVVVRVALLRAAGAPIYTLPAATAFRVERLAPVVTNACYTTAPNGVELSVTGYSTTREVTAAAVSIGDGRNLDVDVEAISAEYFMDDLAVRTGGAFQLRIPVAMPGIAPGGTLSVALKNSVGSSAARQAGRCE